MRKIIQNLTRSVINVKNIQFKIIPMSNCLDFLCTLYWDLTAQTTCFYKQIFTKVRTITRNIFTFFTSYDSDTGALPTVLFQRHVNVADKNTKSNMCVWAKSYCISVGTFSVVGNCLWLTLQNTYPGDNLQKHH